MHFARSRPRFYMRALVSHGQSPRSKCPQRAALTISGNTGNLLALVVRGLSIFKEYYANPEATAEAFDADGYFRTGGRVTLHEDGFIEFSEQAKDLIKVGGEGVAPAEVERVIAEVPGLVDVAVVAKPDAQYGEVVAAFVVIDERMEYADEIRAG